MASVTFTCESEEEAEVIRNAVNRYKWVTLIPLGIDPRNYAPAIPGYSGFGWGGVQSTARDMHKGSISHMSPRMAEAIRLALEARAELSDTYSRTKLAGKLAARMAACIRTSEGQ